MSDHQFATAFDLLVELAKQPEVNELSFCQLADGRFVASTEVPKHPWDSIDTTVLVLLECLPTNEPHEAVIALHEAFGEWKRERDV